MLSAEPILSYRVRDLARAMADRHGGKASSHERALYRIRRRGRLNHHVADRVAIALGIHPLLLWGDGWRTDA